MPRIEIIEKDQTSAGSFAESTDVVYIPGFVDVTQSCLYSDGKYVGIKPNERILFTSVKQFESLCGKQGATFEQDQLYTDLQEKIGNEITGFSTNAIPYHRVMFTKGMTDPSYIMAKEYLNAGLNVLYERVNSDSEFVLLESEPETWKTSYTDYYTEDVCYNLISSTIPPMWYELVPKGATINPTKQYFKAIYKMVDNKETDEINNFVSYTFANDATENTEDAVDIFTPTKSYYQMNYTKVTNTVQWIEGKFFIKEGEKFNLLSKADFNATIQTPTDIYEKTFTEITFENGVLKVMPDNWVKTYFNYYEKLTSIDTIPEHIEVPKFNSFQKLVNGETITNIYRKDLGINIKNMYAALEKVFDSGSIDGLTDKGNYSIKYLTSGGYPTYEYTSNAITAKMIALAVERQDCVAIIDHTDNPYRDDNIDHTNSLYKTVSEDQVFRANGDFATMFTPWAAYNRTTIDKDDKGSIITSVPTRLPASYAYLIALGDSIRTNANWLAIAGSARGVVLNLATDGMTTNIPNGAADAMQPRDGVAVNAITNIKPYGWTIWGNRTLKNNGEKGNLTATSFLNVRNLISDVKKLAYKVARQLTFEQNNDVLWVNFRGLIAPTLDRMLSGYGISGYKIVRDTEHEKASEKATICAKIILYPVYAVEDFYITIVLKDDEISVE